MNTQPSSTFERVKACCLALIYNTHVEIGIGAGVGLIVLGAIGWNVNSDRAKVRPVALSEFGKTQMAYEQAGKQVPPITRLLARCSDTVMRVNEASNFAVEHGGSHASFASEFENKTVRALRVHRLITEDAAVIGTDAREALQSVDKYVQANSALPGITSSFKSAWLYDRDDYEKDEDYYVEECDSKNKCESVKKTRRVYDYSIHHYSYNPQAGQSAQAQLTQYLQKTPNLRIDEQLVLATGTDPENEYAIERSFREFLGNRIPTTAQALGIINTYVTGSNFAVYRNPVEQEQIALHSLATQWQRALGTAHSDSYKTYSTSDSGPAEYRLAKRAAQQAGALNEKTDAVVSGFQYCAIAVPAIPAKMKDYIAVVRDGKPGRPDAMLKDIYAVSDGLYKRNFVAGHEVYRFRPMEIFLLACAGGLVGAGLGWGADKYIDHRRRQAAKQRYSNYR